MNRVLSFLLVFAFVAAAALAATRTVQAEPQKSGSSTLAGIVLGPDDKPVPHAAVSYQSSGGSAPHAVHTDAHGRFRVTKLPADNYDVRASGKGDFSISLTFTPASAGTYCIPATTAMQCNRTLLHRLLADDLNAGEYHCIVTAMSAGAGAAALIDGASMDGHLDSVRGSNAPTG